MTKNTLTQIFDALDRLVGTLYETPEGGVGGLLHIITDDSNIEDHHVLHCWREAHNEEDPWMRNLYFSILEKLMYLTEPQRMIWWLKGLIKKEKPETDIIDLALEVRDGYIVEDEADNGLYTAKISVNGKIVWDGLHK